MYVLSRHIKKCQRFLSENFQFLEVKFSIYLNKRVFIMWLQTAGSFSWFVLCVDSLCSMPPVRHCQQLFRVEGAG